MHKSFVRAPHTKWLVCVRRCAITASSTFIAHPNTHNHNIAVEIKRLTAVYHVAQDTHTAVDDFAWSEAK